MRAARDVAGDRDVVGLVGQDQARSSGPPSEPQQRLGLWSVAADDPMGPELEDVAESATATALGFGRERPLLRSPRRPGIEDDLVDLVERRNRRSRSARRTKISSSNSIFSSSRSHSPFSPRRLTASRRTRCSVSLRCAIRMQGTRGDRGRAASTRTSPSMTFVALPMRTGAQKPKALIEAATSRTWRRVELADLA